MKAVIKERLDEPGRRRASGAAAGLDLLPDAGSPARPEPRAAEAARRDQAGRGAGGAPAADRLGGSHGRCRISTWLRRPDGTIVLTLSPVALNARALGGGAAVDRDRAPPHRRNRRGRSADHPAGRHPHRRAVARHRAIPNRIKELLGKTAHMTFQSGGRDGECQRRRPAAAGRRFPADAGQPGREDRGPQAGGRGWRRPDRRARRQQSARPASGW